MWHSPQDPLLDKATAAEHLPLGAATAADRGPKIWGLDADSGHWPPDPPIPLAPPLPLTGRLQFWAQGNLAANRGHVPPGTPLLGAASTAEPPSSPPSVPPLPLTGGLTFGA